MGFPRDHAVQVGEFNTRYWAGAGQGSPVVLVHGLGASIETWSSNFEELSASHRVFAPDLPAHGRTALRPGASYTLESLAEFIKDFMQAVGLSKAHLVGHSLGGAVSVRVALRYPEMVDRLVLVSPGGFGKQLGLVHRLASLPLLGEILTRPSLAGVDATIKYTTFDPAVISPELREISYQIYSSPGVQQGFLAVLRANGSFFGQKSSIIAPNLAGLPFIKCPVMLVWGRQDQVVPVVHAEVAAKGFPDLRSHIFEHCGHCAMLEYPQRFNKLLLGFLGE